MSEFEKGLGNLAIFGASDCVIGDIFNVYHEWTDEISVPRPGCEARKGMRDVEIQKSSAFAHSQPATLARKCFPN